MIVKVFKWIGLGVLGVILLAVVLVAVVSTVRWNRNYVGFDIPVETFLIPDDDDEAIARGEHIATIYYCGTCHGENLAGGYLVNDPVLAVIPAPNLTAGAGGIGGTNTDADWIRAIRHGVGHDNRGLVGMPSRVWNQMGDDDLVDLIAYLKSIPAVDNELPTRKIGPLFRVLLTLGQAPVAEAAVIDHDAPRPAVPEPGVSVAYGEYLAQGCTACHGVDLNGGMARDFNGDLVVALNLTPGGELGGWTEEQFITTMRTGNNPAGRKLNDLMPWPYLGQMTDEELQAVWLFLQSLPALGQSTERTDL
jgi:mono/diheme cytochrome c family protein